MKRVSIENRAKPCKGTGKAKGHGCGKTTYYRNYGLGKECKCYQNWLYSTPEGQQEILKAASIGKRKVSISRKKSDQEAYIKNMSVSEYKSTYLHPKVQKIARLIDYGQNCISTLKPTKEAHGGHFIAVGANSTISINLHNIHLQSAHSNKWKGGDNFSYRQGLKQVYGIEYLDFCESLQQTPVIRLTKDDCVVLNEVLNRIIKDLEKRPKILSAAERIQLRNEINERLAIYPERFCVFPLEK